MRTMRRRDREIGTRDAIEVLLSCEYGVLSSVGENGQPYGVPLSYAYRDNALYFHSSLSGHKLDNINTNPRVSFCVVGRTHVLPAEFATEYESAVAFGIASEVHGAERRNALRWLLEKYSPDFIEEGLQYIEKEDKVTKVFKVTIDHVTGKARR